MISKRSRKVNTVARFYQKWITSIRSLPVSLKQTARVKRWFADLDRFAQKEYGRNYWNLKDAERTRLHENINNGVYVEKKAQ